MGSKEYKKVGLVGNEAIKKSLFFYQQEKKSQVSRSFFLAKIYPANKIGGRCTSRGSEEYKKQLLVGIQALDLWDVVITKCPIVHQKQKYPKFEGIFLGQKLDLQPKKGVVAHLG